MATTRSTKITFEKRELTLISLPRGAKVFCSKCEAEIERVAIARDANLGAVPVGSELINSTGTAEEKLLSCAHEESLVGEKSKTEER